MPAPEQKTMNEPNIYFSHKTYEKFKNINITKPIKLLEVFNKTTAYMSDTFKDYDTTYKDAGGKKKQYKLHNGMNIILLFQDHNGNLFTTIRSYTVKKFNYYMYMRGKEFSIEITQYDKDDINDKMILSLPRPINNIYL
jgi:hypothetical protein